MANKKTVKEVSVLNVKNDIEADLYEIADVEQYISQIVETKEFYQFEKIKNYTENNSSIVEENTNSYEFVSVNTETITKEEFFEIVESNEKRNFATAGLYQQSLFGRYLEAVKENDQGYIQDIFEKAVDFRDNMERIKQLRKNSNFMKEWRQNVGRTSPESELKRTGSMRKINIIEQMSM